jgi:hypothetical protein
MTRLCPHCKATATFTRRWSNSIASRDGDIDPDKPLVFCETCDNCQSPICGVYPAGGTLEDIPWVWPEAIPHEKIYPDVPNTIANAAAEAHKALDAQAARASVMMARAVVEAIAKDKGITQGKLISKIDQLKAVGHISESMKEAAHEIRLVANEVAHSDILDEPISPKDAAEVVELMDDLLERVYQEPAKVARVRASREARHS